MPGQSDKPVWRVPVELGCQKPVAEIVYHNEATNKA
jgi:hypothetical protein